jgi:glycerol-3-phosphate cytidylyltransferase
MTGDLFHVGHLRAIRKASRRCDYLIVGLLNDPKYKKTIIPFKERKEIIKALPEVYKVVEQKGLKMNLKGVKYVFSGDGFEKEELESIEKAGCKAINIGYYKGQSTTNIKKKIYEKFNRGCGGNRQIPIPSP